MDDVDDVDPPWASWDLHGFAIIAIIATQGRGARSTSFAVPSSAVASWLHRAAEGLGRHDGVMDGWVDGWVELPGASGQMA